MSSPTPTVIIFGPTGSVGSIVAHTAHSKGANVILAMRDVNKPIRGIPSPSPSPSTSNPERYTRIQADLTSPTSVSTAITQTRATRAFIYVAHGTTDHMRTTLTAMKSAGITFVVLLSSYTVQGDLQSYTPRDVIPYIHARVEMALDEVFGEEKYVAMRPGGFATNMLRFREDVVSGEAVPLYEAPMKFDCVTPGDMGRVAGTVLVEGPKMGQRKVYLYGPQEVTQREALEVIGKVLGREIQIRSIDEEEARVQFEKQGFPKMLVEYMVRVFNEVKENPAEAKTRPQFEEGVNNVELYTGRKSMGFEEWVSENRELFTA